MAIVDCPKERSTDAYVTVQGDPPSRAEIDLLEVMPFPGTAGRFVGTPQGGVRQVLEPAQASHRGGSTVIIWQAPRNSCMAACMAACIARTAMDAHLHVCKHILHFTILLVPHFLD